MFGAVLCRISRPGRGKGLMRKLYPNKGLRGVRQRRKVRRAFSLAELVVSMGILALMLTLAGQVMSLTVRSTGQAKAITEVNQQLRAFERTMLEGLRHVQPGRSLLLIQGNPINAFWTEAQQQTSIAGDPLNGYAHGPDSERADPWRAGELQQPRADVLMFFSERPANSKVAPRLSSNIQQVVIGHVNTGQYALDPDLGAVAFSTDPLAQFPTDNATPFRVPAEDWHLGLRQVVLSPAVAVPTNPPNPSSLAEVEVIQGAMDVLQEFDYEAMVIEPGPTFPWHVPAVLPPTFNPTAMNAFSRSQIDLDPPPTVAYGVNQFFLPNCASFKVEWCLDPDADFVGGRLDGEREIFWFDPGDYGTFPDPTIAPDPLRSLRQARAGAVDPARQQRLTELLHDKLLGDGGNVYSLDDRFGISDPVWFYTPGPVNTNNTAIFTAQRPNAESMYDSSPTRPDDVFPAALRITIDIYDRERRLSRPVRHVIIAPLGE